SGPRTVPSTSPTSGELQPQASPERNTRPTSEDQECIFMAVIPWGSPRGKTPWAELGGGIHSRRADRVTAGPRAQGLIQGKVARVLDEADRAVAEGEIGPAGMSTAESAEPAVLVDEEARGPVGHGGSAAGCVGQVEWLLVVQGHEGAHGHVA